MRSIMRHLPPQSASWTEAWDNSHCSLTIDLLCWGWSLQYGVDRNIEACELAHFYVTFGPVRLMLAIGH